MSANSRRFGLAGRRALVSGHRGGIGGAVAALFAAEGAEVIGLDLPEFDLSEVATVEARAAALIGGRGVDVLVNCAGITVLGSVLETDIAEVERVMAVNFLAPYALIRAVLPGMRSRRSGAIVQLSSMGGQMSFAGFSAYSATKFALEGMSEALADEVRPLGIKVLIVEPGAFRTALFSNISASAQIADYTATVGPTRHMIETGNGTQPGDPAKAAAAILTVLDTDEAPLRLPLGDDAVDAILGHLDTVRAEVTTWEKLTRNTRLTQ